MHPTFSALRSWFFSRSPRPFPATTPAFDGVRELRTCFLIDSEVTPGVSEITRLFGVTGAVSKCWHVETTLKCEVERTLRSRS